MARRTIEPPLKKHTLNLRAGDFDALVDIFPNEKPGEAIRRIISLVVDTYRDKAPTRAVQLEPVDL